MITQTLGTEIDRFGETVLIKQVSQLALTPVYTFFLRQMAELIDNGLALPMTGWDDYTCGAVYAEINGKIVGHIVYDTNKKPGIIWITLSAVEKDYRGREIYNMMHRYFEAFGKEKGYHYISSYVHVNNKERIRSAEKVGMNPQYYLMSKKI